MFDLDLFRVARSMPHPSPGQRFAQLMTPWGERLDPDRLAESTPHPRPQLRRDRWQSLDGWWDYAFVKTYLDACETHDGYRKEDIAKVLDVVYAAVQDIRDMNILVLQGRDVFANSIKKQTTAALLKSGLYKRLQMKDWYTDLLHEVYTNIKMF